MLPALRSRFKEKASNMSLTLPLTPNNRNRTSIPELHGMIPDDMMRYVQQHGMADGLLVDQRPPGHLQHQVRNLASPPSSVSSSGVGPPPRQHHPYHRGGAGPPPPLAEHHPHPAMHSRHPPPPRQHHHVPPPPTGSPPIPPPPTARRYLHHGPPPVGGEPIPPPQPIAPAPQTGGPRGEYHY